MTQKIRAIYQDGVFIPQSSCNFPENTEVELIINNSQNLSLEIVDSEVRKQILQNLLRRMRQTTLTVHSRCLVPENVPENC